MLTFLMPLRDTMQQSADRQTMLQVQILPDLRRL